MTILNKTPATFDLMGVGNSVGPVDVLAEPRRLLALWRNLPDWDVHSQDAIASIVVG